jgi:hypothetical protein
VNVRYGFGGYGEMVEAAKHKTNKGRLGSMMSCEDSRVKILCILHLIRLGYRQLALKGAAWEDGINLFRASKASTFS